MTIGEEREHFGYDPVTDKYVNEIDEYEDKLPGLPIAVVFFAMMLGMGAGVIFAFAELIKYIR